MRFRLVLEDAGYRPEDVAVVLHTTNLPRLRRLLPWLVEHRPDLFDAYQSVHSDMATATLRKRQFAASFVPEWRDLVLTSAEVRLMPESWRRRLAEWRGIYMILDATDGGRYVGSAYGKENLAGRWKAHVAGEQGVTVELARRDTAGFCFSILERVSPDLPDDEVVALEASWKRRLYTLDFGLNRQ